MMRVKSFGLIFVLFFMVDEVCQLNGAVDLSDEVGESVIVVMMRNDNGFDAGMNVGDMTSFTAFGIEGEVSSEKHFFEVSYFRRHKGSVTGWGERIEENLHKRKKK